MEVYGERRKPKLKSYPCATTLPPIGHAHGHPQHCCSTGERGKKQPETYATRGAGRGGGGGTGTSTAELHNAAYHELYSFPHRYANIGGKEDEVDDRGGHDSIPGISGKKARQTLGKPSPFHCDIDWSTTAGVGAEAVLCRCCARPESSTSSSHRLPAAAAVQSSSAVRPSVGAQVWSSR